MYGSCSSRLKHVFPSFNLRFAFFLYDVDESGKLEKEEVEDMVKAVYGEKFADDERVRRVLECLDANGDGEVSRVGSST